MVTRVDHMTLGFEPSIDICYRNRPKHSYFPWQDQADGAAFRYGMKPRPISEPLLGYVIYVSRCVTADFNDENLTLAHRILICRLRDQHTLRSDKSHTRPLMIYFGKPLGLSQDISFSFSLVLFAMTCLHFPSVSLRDTSKYTF